MGLNSHSKTQTRLTLTLSLTKTHLQHTLKSIRIHWDWWIPNHPTNKVLYLANEETESLLLSDLIDQELHWWKRELIMSLFHNEDAEAICRIPLSHRDRCPRYNYVDEK